MPQQLQETVALTEAAVAAAKTTGRMPVQLISPGWGSSGYYSAEVLEQAVNDGLFEAGLQMFADHPTPDEAKARPVRSIKDLMSVTVIPGRIATQEDIDGWGAEPGAIVAETDVLPAYRDVIEHLKDAIGLSIRGDGELVEGEAEGRRGRIVESLVHVQSVDWVTRPGRGGRVLSLVESARANARAIGHGLSEATVNDTREALQTALRDAYGAAPVDRSVWVYVRDFDDTTVWFEVEGSGASDPGVYGQTYTQDAAGAVTLTGDRTEVRVRTEYVPVAPTTVPATRPDSTTTTESLKEDAMGKPTNLEEAQTALTEANGRVTQLEEQLSTVTAERDQLREEKARTTRITRAGQIVEARAKDAGVTYTPLEVKGLCADLPVKEDGTLDEAAFTKTVDEDAAARKAEAGAGTVRGFGGVTETASGGSGSVTLDQIDEALGLKKGA